MNIDENLDQYKSRKLAQFDKIVALITQASIEKPIDCIFLQEIDWTRMLNTEVTLGSTDEAQKMLCQSFIKKLDALGWGFVLAPQSPKGAKISQQTLMTLYNKNSLTPVENSGLGVLPSTCMEGKNQRYRGYQMTFTHVNGQPIDLVNFHLNYEYDHREDLINVMENSIAKNHTVVMGGDANHPPNFNMDTLTGDWGSATAVDKNDIIFKQTKNVVMTTHHVGTRQQNIAKHYDGFSAGSTYKLRIVKEQGEHFELIQNQVKLVPDQLDSKHPHHESEASYPWMRGRALLVHLDKKLPSLQAGPEQHAMLNKMGRIAQTRFNESLDKAASHKNYPLVNAQKLHLEQKVPASIQLLDNNHIVITAPERTALREVMARLHYGSTSSNPYYMNSKAKLDKIIDALSNLPENSNFHDEMSNQQSALYKAINMQRISPFTLFGALGFNKSKSLMRVTTSFVESKSLS